MAGRESNYEKRNHCGEDFFFSFRGAREEIFVSGLRRIVGNPEVGLPN